MHLVTDTDTWNFIVYVIFNKNLIQTNAPMLTTFLGTQGLLVQVIDSRIPTYAEFCGFKPNMRHFVWPENYVYKH